MKDPHPCEEINTLFYHLHIFQGQISTLSIESLSEVKQAKVSIKIYRNNLKGRYFLIKKIGNFLNYKDRYFLIIKIDIS